MTLQVARERFDAYAHLDVPELPQNKFSALQVRLCRWERANFGTSMPERHALGISEELGELIDSVYGFSSKIWVTESEDAVGDIMVYATQLCTGARLDFGSLYETAQLGVDALRGSPFHGLASVVGRISHAVLKSAQGIRGYHESDKYREAIAGEVTSLIKYLALAVRQLRCSSLDKIYVSVAEDVMTRNWKTNPSGPTTEQVV